MTRRARSAVKAADAASRVADESTAPSPADVLLTGPARRPDAAQRSATPMPGVVRGTIVAAADDGRPLVTWPGAPAPVVAEPVWMAAPPRWSDCAGLGAVVGFEEGDPSRPLLLGLLGAPSSRRAAPPAEALPADAPQAVHIEGREELVLQCGDAKIVLRADGSVTIRGAKVVTRARGVNKIRGGSVQIN